MTQEPLLYEDQLRLEDSVEDALARAREGNKIRDKRIKLGLNQLEMAKLLEMTQAT